MPNAFAIKQDYMILLSHHICKLVHYATLHIREIMFGPLTKQCQFYPAKAEYQTIHLM